MKNLKVISTIAIIALISSACGRRNANDPGQNAMGAVDPVEATIETGVTLINGLADDQAGSSYALSLGNQKTSVWSLLLGKEAYAALCERVAASPMVVCNNNVKEVQYDNCELGTSGRTLNGFVQLTYSHASCTLSTDGDSVNREYDITISGPRGGIVTHTSEAQSDYKVGPAYGGGGTVTKTAAGWDLSVAGRHSSFSFKNREIFNVSVRTIQPLNISGGLGRSNRHISNGQLEVNHNLAKFTAVFTANNLQWTSSCCHPTSGSLGVVYSGSKSGSATVTFNGCGAASVDQGGQQQSIELSYCE